MLALDPAYKLRRTETNIFFYRFDPDAMDVVDQRTLHPNVAILLALFNGQNSLDDIRSSFQYLLDLPNNSFSLVFEEFMKEWRPFMIETRERVRTDDPSDFVISAEKIDHSHLFLDAPIHLVLNLTNRCGGRNCIYCYAEGVSTCKPADMSLPHAEHIVSQAEEIGVEYITLSGGDAFVMPNVFRIIDLIVKSGIEVQLSTKQFLSRHSAAELLNMGVTRVQISIDCLDNSLSEILTGVPRYASRAIQTIERLQKSGLTVTTNSVVTGLNIHDIPSLIRRLVSMGIPTIRLSQYFRSAYHHSDNLFLEGDGVAQLAHFVDSFGAEHMDVSIRLSALLISSVEDTSETLNRFLKRPMCSAGRLSMLILQDGKVLPCEQMPSTDEYVLGDTSAQSIREIWNSPRFRAFFAPDRSRFEGTTCYNCEHFEACVHDKGWCFRDAWKAYGTAYQINPMCPKAFDTPGKRMS